MTAIHICALARLEETVRHSRARYVVTAINPWSIPATPAGILPNNHLRLAINDIDAPHGDLIHPEAHHIEQLIAFTKRWNRDGPIVIHCLAGISRSSASAFIAACTLNPATAENTIAMALRKASATARPNPLMIALADAVLDRKGRMIAAINGLSPGVATLESETFSIPSCY